MTQRFKYFLKTNERQGEEIMEQELKDLLKSAADVRAFLNARASEALVRS